MNMEIALFLGHILVLTMRDITNMPTLCKIAGVGFQFFFLASFCFMLLEALQAYAIRTNVISYGGYCSRLQSFVIGWGMSAVITGVTAVIRHKEYVSYWSCWLNLGSSVVYASTGPVLILSAVTIIIAEASGMGNYTALLDRNQDQYTAANANAKALFIVLPLSTASWFVGLYAVYHANIALYSVVHALNVALGISIFVFHSLGNPKTLCKIAGVGFQFFFLASFCFMLLEALQAYAIRTNVISYGGYCSRLQSFVIGWGMSAVITGVTAVIRHQEYVSYWSYLC